jgi:hypothetical protein
VRNVVAAWKSRSPSIDRKYQLDLAADTTPEEGLFSIRRRAGTGFQRERASMGGESGPITLGRSGPSQEVPSTPRSSKSLTPSEEVSLDFDYLMSSNLRDGWRPLLTCVVFLFGLFLWTDYFSLQPLCTGLPWYLSVHAPPPYRQQRCQAVLNCTEVRSVALPTHPSAQDDVGMIAARVQTADAQAEGFGELGLLETLCPSQLFYGDGVERLGADSADSARERVRWISAIWYVLLCRLFL